MALFQVLLLMSGIVKICGGAWPFLPLTNRTFSTNITQHSLSSHLIRAHKSPPLICSQAMGVPSCQNRPNEFHSSSMTSRSLKGIKGNLVSSRSIQAIALMRQVNPLWGNTTTLHLYQFGDCLKFSIISGLLVDLPFLLQHVLLLWCVTSRPLTSLHTLFLSWDALPYLLHFFYIT